MGAKEKKSRMNCWSADFSTGSLDRQASNDRSKDKSRDPSKDPCA